MHAPVKVDALAVSGTLETRPAPHTIRPSRMEAEMAVRTLIRWAGDDPDREGLIDRPTRIVRAYEQWFAGYAQDPAEFLRRTFAEVAGYDEMVVLRNIRFVSYCEHHMAPITGCAHIGYLPCDRIVGISKIARVVDAYSNRLQIQEKMTAEIANTLACELQPRGVGVVVEAAAASTDLKPPWSRAVCSACFATGRGPAMSSRRRSTLPGLPGPGTFAADEHPMP